MKKYKLIISLMFLVILTSFKDRNDPKLNINFGTYGDSNIGLTLNENHTFHYTDLSNPNNKIDVKGTWEIKKDYIILNNEGAQVRFHKNWKLDNNNLCIKSRIGLNFYRLCHSELCK